MANPKADNFFEAIARGDLSAAAEVLRTLDGLTVAECQILADLLANDPQLTSLFPYRFRLSKHRGKVDSMKKWAEIFLIVRAVKDAQKKFGKLEAAVEEVIKKQKNISRPKIFRALAAAKKSKIS